MMKSANPNCTKYSYLIAGNFPDFVRSNVHIPVHRKAM
jgi:hypothetical protein